MALALATTITGGAQSGMTAPTYTMVVDRPPDPRAQQFLVSAVGGTQPLTRLHSPSDPFTVTTRAPQSFRQRPVISADGIIIGTVAMNEYRLLVRKGMQVYSNNVRNGYIDVRVGVPAGADAVDPTNIRAMWSLFCGIATANPSILGTDCVLGTW